MSKTIDQIIESRIELGNNYLSQSKVVMPIFETFESRILTTLEDNPENKDAFRAIKNRTPVVWTDITDSMIRVYNTGSEYAEVKNLLYGEKSLQRDNRYGIYIFTDEADKINYVLAGSTASNDTVYVSQEAQGLLEERYDIVKEAKDDIIKNYQISLNNLPLGTRSDDTKQENKVTLAELLLKCIYDFICRAKNNVNYNGRTYDLNDPIDKYSVIDGNNYSTYQEAYEAFKKVTDDYYLVHEYIQFKGNSTDWMYLRDSYRAHPDAYDVYSFVNKRFLRRFMALSLITVDISSSDAIVRNKYTVTDVYGAQTSNLETIYNELYDKPLRNSVIYNLSIKTGDGPKDLKKSRDVTRFEQLMLIPDKLSHLYKIQQDVDVKGERGFIEDFDEKEFLDDDPNKVIDKFKGDDATAARRRNFDTGIRKRADDRFSARYTPADRNFTNVEGNQGRALKVIQDARRRRSFGSTASSDDTERNLAQLRRDSLWAQRQAELGNKKYFDLQREISDLRTAGTIQVENVIDILQKALSKAEQGVETIQRLMDIAQDAANYAITARRVRGEYKGIIDQAIETVRNCHTTARGIANGNNCNPRVPGIDEGKFFKEGKGDKADLAAAYIDSINTCKERMDDLVETLTYELNRAKKNPSGTITINGIPINIKYSRIPQVKLRKIFKTFEDTYDSVKNNTAGEFKDLLEAYKDFYVSTKTGSYLNTIINFYSSMTAMMEFLNDIISYGTFGSMEENDFIQMVFNAYDNYNNYIDNLFDLTEALQGGDTTAVEQFMGSFAQMTKEMKSSLKTAGKNFDLSVASYEEAAKNNYKPNDYIPDYTRTVKN